MAIEARDGRPTFTDLGAGNFPTISPDDKWIAFSLYPGAEPKAEAEMNPTLETLGGKVIVQGFACLSMCHTN
jgi:hypothetical protein